MGPRLLLLCLVVAPSLLGAGGGASAISTTHKKATGSTPGRIARMLRESRGRVGHLKNASESLEAARMGEPDWFKWEAPPEKKLKWRGGEANGMAGLNCSHGRVQLRVAADLMEQCGVQVQSPGQALPLERTMTMRDLRDWGRSGRKRKKQASACTFEGCENRATFGPDDEGKIALRCAIHRIDQLDIQIVGSYQCRFHAGCTTFAAYGDSTIPLFCAEHRLPGHINVACRFCQAPGCPKVATFSDLNAGGPPLFCGTHRGVQHRYTRANRVRPYCQNPTCVKQPTFGFEGDRIRRFCREHKRSDDIYLVNGRRVCEVDGCLLIPTFGNPKTGTPRFCVTHKEEGHVSTVNMLCREIGCSMRAMYAEKTGDCPRYCLKHKKPGHLHVYNQCQHPGCALRPLFGRMLRSQPMTRHCAVHKEPSEVVLKSATTRHCHHPEGCVAQPSYGEKWSNIRQFCSRHKLPGHVNLLVQLCTAGGCSKVSTYGDPNDKIARLCAVHRGKDHIDVRNRKCIHERCTKQASYGSRLEGAKIYCFGHKAAHHIHVSSQGGPRSWGSAAQGGQKQAEEGAKTCGKNGSRRSTKAQSIEKGK